MTLLGKSQVKRKNPDWYAPKNIMVGKRNALFSINFVNNIKLSLAIRFISCMHRFDVCAIFHFDGNFYIPLQ